MRGVLICLGFAFFAVGIVFTLGVLNVTGLTLLSGVGVVILALVHRADTRREATNAKDVES